MCMHELSCRVYVDRHLSDTLPVHVELKQGDAFSSLCFNFAVEYTIRKVNRIREG
jgi:hypothetical protein